MYKAEIDLPVLIIFFARPKTLSAVFEKVKKARPTKLFLACDGPRNNNEREKELIEQSKQIVSDINWECEVHTNYATENLGCGRGPASAISWAFNYVDKLLILEDDCVPDDCLFMYMKEMLDRYENDTRIGLVSGFNHLKEWDTGDCSYLFTQTGATLGWGTWKRVWDKYDFHVENINNPYYYRLVNEQFRDKKIARRRVLSWVNASKRTKTEKVNYWDIQFGFLKYSQSYLIAVPKYNLIYNIGIGEGSTHTEKTKYTKWKKGQILFMPTKSLETPLVHPECVMCDIEYDKVVAKMIFPSKIKRAFKKLKRKLFK